jgi:hypothetical protein
MPPSACHEEVAESDGRMVRQAYPWKSRLRLPAGKQGCLAADNLVRLPTSLRHASVPHHGRREVSTTCREFLGVSERSRQPAERCRHPAESPREPPKALGNLPKGLRNRRELSEPAERSRRIAARSRRRAEISLEAPRVVGSPPKGLGDSPRVLGSRRKVSADRREGSANCSGLPLPPFPRGLFAAAGCSSVIL